MKNARKNGKTKGRTLTPPSVPDVVKPYEPTVHERAAAQRLLDQRKCRAPAPKFKVAVEDGKTVIDPDHAEPVVAFSILTDVFCTSDAHFAEGLLGQLANAARTGNELTARELNTMVATVHAIGPRDPIEALLASQMAAIHQATMVAARRLNFSETIDQQDSSSGMLNKLARTFASQVEALKRYRSTGEQSVKVTHQHVSVTASQAVVGINNGGGGAHEKSRQSHAIGVDAGPGALDAPSSTVFGQEQAIGLPLPGTSRQRAECVQDARGESRSPDRKG